MEDGAGSKTRRPLKNSAHLDDVGRKVVSPGEDRRRLLLHPPHAVVGTHGHHKGLAVDYLPSGTEETATAKHYGRIKRIWKHHRVTTTSNGYGHIKPSHQNVTSKTRIKRVLSRGLVKTPYKNKSGNIRV